jgi:hypothetical protein
MEEREIRRSRPRAALVLAAGVLPLGALADVTYQWDDGAGNVRLGPVFAAEYMWGNVYSAQPGGETINSISVAFGAIPANQALTVYLFQDPTPGDNDPRDAVLVAASTGVTPDSPPLNSFWTYPIAPTTISGDFFVGVSTHVRGQLSDLTVPDTPARVDPQGISNAAKSWVFGADDYLTGGLGSTPLADAPYSLQLTQSAIKGVVMVRANGVPTPGSLVLVGVAGMVAGVRRRSR